MKSRTVHIGESIFKEGEEAHHAYLIKSGRVKIIKMGKDGYPRTISELGKGDIVGEMALIDNEPREASAIAEDITEILIITEDVLAKRLDTCDQVVAMLLKSFTQRLRDQARRQSGHA